MAENWLDDVLKYDPNANPDAVAGIVRYCGIALRNRDSSLVSFSDPAETGRVRERFLQKKLGLTDPVDVLDRAIADVGERMKADRTKNRVTVYYLLADRFGMLHLFDKGAKAAAVDSDTNDGGAGAAAAGLASATEPERPDVVTPISDARAPSRGPMDEPEVSGAAAAPLGGNTSERAFSRESLRSRIGDSSDAVADVPEASSSRWWLWLLLALVALAILFFLIRGSK